jgi:hypothetical protein
MGENLLVKKHCIDVSLKIIFHNETLKPCISWAIMNQHPPIDHPLNACYYSIVDELQLS